jgi:hypothetical protein
MPRRPKYPSEVSVRIPKDITVLYETPILQLLLTEKEAEMAERIINYIKTNQRLWPDEWKIIVSPQSPKEIRLYYRTLRKLVSLGLIGRGKEGSFILSGELTRKLTVMIEKINALTGGGM